MRLILICRDDWPAHGKLVPIIRRNDFKVLLEGKTVSRHLHRLRSHISSNSLSADRTKMPGLRTSALTAHPLYYYCYSMMHVA